MPSDDPQNAPFEPPRLLALLARLGIETRTYPHDPVLTVAEARIATAHVPGFHCKNLFLDWDSEETRAARCRTGLQASGFRAGGLVYVLHSADP